MAGIFISYRRDDSAAQARAVWERLCRELGRDHVFMDVDGIDPGDDFTEVIDRLRIPPIADTHSKLIADSVPGDRGHRQ